MYKLIIVFDNYAYLEGFPTPWGFACFIETPETTFLFDTGSNGRVLLKNMERLGVDLQKAEALVLSHPHWDHIGGVDSVLEVHPNLRIFAPSSLSKHLVRDLNAQSLGVTVIGEEPWQILPDVWSTGTMGEIGEQSVVIDTYKGLVVVTGCAHPGVENIAARAMEMLGKPIDLLMGGFHLMYSDAAHIASVIETLRRLGVRNVCPTHCNGDLAIEMFKVAFGSHFLRGGVGRVIEL
ncbi:MBL fold metallo-hydrolase [Hydrogenimonas urashimensis]|uniref:MBL fold metallo-hydrolase n=1 Tax=Hydrogenimonas urashimensis TaxID=2740515 RepID=UPI00191527BB|nr:MBL fold metallo-hydrolase [Hydrogenimonas urashimensis]